MKKSGPQKGVMPDYPTGNTLYCDVTLEVVYVGGTSSVEPSQQIVFPCTLPPPGLGVAGIPIAIGELKKLRVLMWGEAKKMVAAFENKPKVDWVRFHKVQYQTDKTDPIFTTDFIRKFVLADQGHSDIPADF